MKNLHVAALATLFGISAASGIALTQAQHPSDSAGIFASTALIAAADQDNRGNGNGRGKNNQYNQNGQCNTSNNNNTRRSNGDQNDQGNQNNQNNQNNGHGKKRGWQNPNNPHYCGANGNCGYNNGQYGQNNGQYGQNNGQCNGQGQGQGNTSIRGTITSVNGNQVTVMEGFGQTVTINDQPALDNQNTGRVVIGRYVTAYGYYQNGIFYATSMQ
jgi:hypothetical protein